MSEYEIFTKLISQLYTKNGCWGTTVMIFRTNLTSFYFEFSRKLTALIISKLTIIFTKDHKISSPRTGRFQARLKRSTTLTSLNEFPLMRFGLKVKRLFHHRKQCCYAYPALHCVNSANSVHKLRAHRSATRSRVFLDHIERLLSFSAAGSRLYLHWEQVSPDSASQVTKRMPSVT